MLNKHYDNWLDLSLDTKVVDCLKEEDRYLISLEDTVFFFESGGQKKDIGTINNHEVLDLIEKEGNFYHVLAVPLTGDVHLEVDKKHRMIQAQIHSASHLMCTLINKRFNAKTIAFFNDELEAGAEMGFETLEESTIKRIEELCNEYIRQDIHVEIMYPEYEEAIKHVSIKKADHDVLRAVKIGDIDYDMCACVHVPSLRYLQSFKIIRHEKTTRGYKIFFLVGDQLRNTYQRQYDILRGLSSKLSVPVMKVEEAFDKYNQEYQNLINKNNKLNEAYISLLKDKYVSIDNKVIIEEIDFDRKQLSKLVSMIINETNKLVFMYCIENENIHLIVGASKEFGLKANEIFKDISLRFNLKGGGNIFVAQGGGKYDESIKEYILETYGKNNI